MKTYRAKTFSKRKEDVQRNWCLIDAEGKVLGRLASEIAEILAGKDKADYTAHIDGGDYVVLINAAKISVTRGKESKKVYTKHSNFPGGMSKETFSDLLRRKPEEVIKSAVKGMIKDNRLRDARLARLKVFADEKHTYANFIKE